MGIHSVDMLPSSSLRVGLQELGRRRHAATVEEALIEDRPTRILLGYHAQQPPLLSSNPEHAVESNVRTRRNLTEQQRRQVHVPRFRETKTRITALGSGFMDRVPNLALRMVSLCEGCARGCWFYWRGCQRKTGWRWIGLPRELSAQRYMAFSRIYPVVCHCQWVGRPGARSRMPRKGSIR